ncbi:MAG: MASE4 domain-containing protein, partial [Candidatus Eremiobacteraeota bacterium]|nr:MASE4 domain-containing protein [Candidatus Eremiobacteraeota bacterium]
MVAPFGYAQAVQVTAFVPAFSAAAFVAMALTATLLFAQYRAGRYLPLAILALAYVSSALLSLLYVLTFPLVFSPTGLLGAGSQTAAWLHLGWHVLFCVLVALYVVADSGAFAEKSWFTFRRLAFCVATLVVAFGTFATLGHDALPVIIRDGKHTALFNTFVAPFVVGTLFFTTVFLIAVTRLRTRSHLWLSVVLLAILVETIMVSYESGGRYSYGWYCARVELAAGSIIFLMMLQIQYTAILRRVTLSNSRLEERNAQVEEFIERQKNIAAALPSRARVVDIILDFALQCTAGDGSVMESLQDDEIVYEAAKGTMAPYVGMRKPRSRSLSALSVDLGEALYSSDTSTDLRVFGARSQQLNIGSMIVVPIPISPSVTIVLKVTSQRRSAFAAADISTLQLAATNLSSGLRAAEEFTELEAAELDQRLYARQLRALHVIASTTTVESENQVDEALRLVLEQLDLDWAYLGILDYATNELKIDRSVSGHGARVLEVDNRIPLSSIGIAGVTRADGVFVVDDAAALSDCPLYGGWSSYIAVPLRIAGVRYGAIGFTSRRVRNAAFSEGNAKFVAVAGELIASAIAAKIKKEQLAASEMRYRALTDAMPQLVWVIDAKAKLHYVNERWSTYTGLDMHQSAAIAGDIIVGSEFRTIIANHSDTSP